MATLTSPSLGKLISNVRNFLNSPNEANSFWSNGELAEYLNEGVRMYAAEVLQHSEGQFTTKTTLAIVSGTETVALPADCFVVRALRKKVTDGYMILNYVNDINDSYATNGGSSSQAYFPDYTFRGNNIVLRPTPNFSEVDGLELEYIQFPDVMQNAGDLMTAQVLPIFKNLIEMYAVYKAKLKESLVNGVNMHAIAQDNVNDLASSFTKAIERRSLGFTCVRPFNPESE